MKIHALLILYFGVLAKCSLLEMSQVLWARLLAGGLAKSGQLDPLRVPVIKVDQSEGNTSYRIILRNVEIRGLNLSTLESVHIARGKLKSNLSEFEAGYVSYSDLSEVDSIRYRFHTLVKEPKSKNESGNLPHVTAPVRSQSADHRNRESEIHRSRVDDRNRFQSARSDNSDAEDRDDSVDVVYAQSYKPFEQLNLNDQNIRQGPEGIRCFGSCIRNRDPSRISADNSRSRDIERIRGNRKYTEFSERPDATEESDARVSASENFEQQRTFVRVRQPGVKIVSSPETRNNRKYESTGSGREAVIRSQAYQRQDETRRLSNSNLRADTDRVRDDSRNNYQAFPEDYVDIIYADNQDQRIKHFAGMRRKDELDMKVYALEEIRRSLAQLNRFLIPNGTETADAIQKRNNLARVAAESKRIEDLIRYAENFQERQGYFEQGMQMIYHFGGMDESDQKPESNEAKRRKREHSENDTEDDIMHVILKLQVPMLQVKADYVLNGKVGRQILRGNGLLTGNFPDLIGEFTLELKKSDGNTMIVRAARAKLVAAKRKVILQGMNEKGPVESVLVHGLMAAEAVAAMIADDLATKALSQNRTTDAMIFKMYTNDPAAISQ